MPQAQSPKWHRQQVLLHHLGSLIGRKIVGIRVTTEKERLDLFWDDPAIIMELDNGTLILPATDEELNGPGCLLLFRKNRRAYSISPEELK